jgi:hypothetical protein
MSEVRRELAKLFKQQARISEKIAELMMHGVEEKAPQPRVERETAWTERPLDPAWRQYCVDKRPDLDPESTYEEFSEYYLSTSKRWKSWKLVWQRWVRNQRASNGISPKGGGMPMGGQALQDYASLHGLPLARPGETERNYRDRIMAIQKKIQSG